MIDSETSRGRDWQPWAVVALIALALATLALAERGRGGKLTALTAGSGGPLTAEQRSVDFRAADLTFEVLPDSRAIKGHSVLTLKVLRPIERIQFDLDRNLPIEAISVSGQPLGKDRWAPGAVCRWRNISVKTL